MSSTNVFIQNNSGNVQSMWDLSQFSTETVITPQSNNNNNNQNNNQNNNSNNDNLSNSDDSNSAILSSNSNSPVLQSTKVNHSNTISHNVQCNTSNNNVNLIDSLTTNENAIDFSSAAVIQTQRNLLKDDLSKKEINVDKSKDKDQQISELLFLVNYLSKDSQFDNFYKYQLDLLNHQTKLTNENTALLAENIVLKNNQQNYLNLHQNQLKQQKLELTNKYNQDLLNMKQKLRAELKSEIQKEMKFENETKLEKIKNDHKKEIEKLKKAKGLGYSCSRTRHSIPCKHELKGAGKCKQGNTCRFAHTFEQIREAYNSEKNLSE